MRILVVEDQRTQREALASLLREDGFEVVEASGAQMATARFRDQAIDMVLLDYSLAGTEAPEVIARLREIEAELDRPACVIACVVGSAALTVVDGVPSFDDRREQLEHLGVDGHFTKPVDFDRLLAFINERRG